MKKLTSRLRTFAVSLRLMVTVMCGVALIVSPELPFEVAAATKSGKSKKSGSRRRSGKKNYSNTRVKVLWKSADGSQWIRRGRRGIITWRDSAGFVRSMQPYSGNGAMGRPYSEAINAYAAELAPDSVRVYSLIAPSQGEYYMPEMLSTAGAEQAAIEQAASYLSPDVTPIFVNDTLKAHLDEKIYSRTDHHWSPLGAYYASKLFAEVAGVGFRPMEQLRSDTIHDYVGSMYRYTYDPEIKKASEDFIYYMPPEGYTSEFITYTIEKGKTRAESEPNVQPFFKDLPDGSGAAYCVFMGGDTRTVKTTGTGGTPGRRLLIVKDSYGNAMASCLFGSFEEVHVVDFRYFPHNLVDYARDNGITDLLFVHSLSLAFAPGTTERLNIMLKQGKDSDR
ncbi:MAG: hypothetical protein K2O00_06710 [Muribaculaceae bacterium]|nr:hypothetical protein [Muribaculaceae bacterium]